MKTAKYYHCQRAFEDGFVLTAEDLEDARKWYKESADGDGGSFEIDCDVFPVYVYDKENGLFNNAAGDTVYFCDRSGGGWIVNFEGTMEEADEYRAELFRAANYCG